MYTGRSCWLCGRNGTAEPLDKHHIFGGAYRKKSEKYGMTVYLCHGSCHIFGEKAVHSCRETMDELHRYGQKMAMERMGWTKEDFMRETPGRRARVSRWMRSKSFGSSAVRRRR